MMIENRILKDAAVTGYTGGGGKSHLLRAILAVSPDHCFSISHTNRPPRGKEENGKDYYFVDTATIKQMIADGEFLEYTNPRDDVYYGTSVAEYKRIRSLGKAIAFDVDYKGILQLRQNKEISDSLCVIVPMPNASTRHGWMERRGDTSPDEIARRMNHSERVERPFLENEANHFLFDWILNPYDEFLPYPDIFIANAVANYISGKTPLLEIPQSEVKSLTPK